MTNQSIILHRGSVNMTREELALIPYPDETATFKPLPHFDLANKVLTITQDLLKGFHVQKETYGVNRQGAQLFALISFYQENNPDHGISVGFRNSLDKSMAIGFVLGANVFVCDNMSLHGDISIMRKHTVNMFDDLENMLISTVYKSAEKLQLIDQALRLMQLQTINDTQAFSIAGNLFARGIVSPRQLPVLIEQWNKPLHATFEPRTLYSLYNGATEALKTSPPDEIMEKHIELHNFVIKPDNMKDIIPEYHII